ncbi:MAG: glycosyltransferase family 2 protein [Pseudomonadales bacterium]|nr:glycosyltransferase family 2 protein [Pseudomonadales bacterium]MBO6596002.1 glycosyltransferase family 2 protein [Pseudomonadales bacterium]MBO6822485.1 glycosyltransferase family 2 protein [Pseudomonadales bacterium]
MTGTPLVSIIIPVYNRKRSVLDSVESCLNQDWDNIEIIIVDDGSTDDTASTIRSMLSKEWLGKPIKLITQKNRGPSAARNNGFEKANGEFIQFLDSDDLLESQKISKQIAKLKESPDSAFCSCYGKLSASADNHESERIGLCTSNTRELAMKLVSDELHVMCTNAPLWRRDFLEKQPKWNEAISIGDDLEYHLRLVLASRTWTYCPEALFEVRAHETQRVSYAPISHKQTKSEVQTLTQVYQTLVAHKLWDSEFQSQLCKAARTVYFKAIKSLSDEELNNYESQLSLWTKAPNTQYLIHLLIFLRKSLGRNAILSAQRLRARFSNTSSR